LTSGVHGHVAALRQIVGSAELEGALSGDGADGSPDLPRAA
jgi:hypothetical protein